MNKTLAFLAIAVLCIVAGLLVLSLLRGGSVSEASDSVNTISGLLFSASVLFGGLVWWFWNPIIVWLMTDKEGQRGSAEAIKVYQAQRNRFAVLLITIEIVLVQNVFGRFVGWAV